MYEVSEPWVTCVLLIVACLLLLGPNCKKVAQVKGIGHAAVSDLDLCHLLAACPKAKGGRLS